jgi:hypothetical protein
MSDQIEMLKGVNGSGFPFQIGVRKEIEKSSKDHGWAVDAEEHRWTHPAAKRAGFIDLVISHQELIFTVLIECKRVSEDAKWLFLTPRDYSSDRKRISALCTNKRAEDAGVFVGWCDFEFDPISSEAAYCVFRGQDERNPMLERIADDLLPAVEAVGLEEMTCKMTQPDWYSDWRLFLPVIVTNAALYTCVFDADRVGMNDGRLPEGSCEFKPVSFVRFRKSLATHYPAHGITPGHHNSLRQSNLAMERTVLIINSAALSESLKSLNEAEPRNGTFGRKLFGLNP